MSPNERGAASIPERYRAPLAAALVVAVVAVLVVVAANIVDNTDDTADRTDQTNGQEPRVTSAPTEPESFDDIASTFDLEDHLERPGWGTGTGYPAFRMFCEFSHLGYEDPILAPGEEFMHLHMFFGHTELDRDSTWSSLRSSGDSTCQGGPINRTGYWFPAVFDSADQVVIPDEFELYYKAENAEPTTIVQPYPNGLRMIGTDASVTHAEVGGSFRLAVRFPYCWDGESLWEDDGSHMAFGTNNGWGPCPSSHPVHLIELTEFADFDDVHESTDDWYLSSDRMDPEAPNFSTLHADWFGAWDPEVLEWITECLRLNTDASGGSLCDLGDGSAQLTRPDEYTGPKLIDGQKATP